MCVHVNSFDPNNSYISGNAKQNEGGIVLRRFLLPIIRQKPRPLPDDGTAMKEMLFTASSLCRHFCKFFCEFFKEIGEVFDIYVVLRAPVKQQFAVGIKLLVRSPE